MKDKVMIGIDLGQHGGICIDDGVELVKKVMPLTKENVLDVKALKTLLLDVKSTRANICVVFEDITPLHLASAKANWSLASQSGAVEAICLCLDIAYQKVPPKVWQKEMFKNLPPMRTEKGSSDTKGLASVAVKILHPGINLKTNTRSNAVDHDGIVDAILLAEWGKRTLK